MLSSVLEAPVSSQAQPPESSVSTCGSEFYKVSTSLFAEFETDGSQHAELELSQLRIVPGGNWSALADEKCRLQFRNHEGTPEKCSSSGRSPAAEESQIKGRNEQTMDVMEAPASLKRSTLESRTKAGESPLLETTKEAVEVMENVAAEGRKMGCFEVEKFSSVVVASEMLQQESPDALKSEAQEQMEWERQETLEKVDNNYLEQAAQVVLEREACETLASKKALGWESQLALEREALEVLKVEALGLLKQEAREALDKESKEVAVQKVLHHAMHEMVERATQEEAWEELATQRALQQEAGRVLVVQRRASQEATSQETEEQENWATMDLEALEQEAQEALERETQEALEQEVWETLEQEAREVLEYETRKRLEQDAREALEQEAHEAACRELAEQENWAAMVVEQDNWAVMDLEARVGLEQEQLELEAWESVQCEQEALDVAARESLQGEAREALGRESWDAACQEETEQENWAAMDQENSLGLQQEAQELAARESLQSEQEALEVVPRESLQCVAREELDTWDAACPEEMEQENWAAMDLEAQSAEKEASIKPLSTSDETPYQNEMLATIVPMAREYLSRCRRTITDVLDREGETQENALGPSPCKESPALMEPFATRVPSRKVQSVQMIEPLPADSSECIDEDQPLTSCEPSHVGTFVFSEPLTTLNKKPSEDTTHTDTECTSATVCLVPSAIEVYNTTNQEDGESPLKVVDEVCDLVLHSCSSDSDNVVESPPNGNVVSSNIITGMPTRNDSIKGFTCDQEVAVPPFTGKPIFLKKADRTPTIVSKVSHNHGVQENSVKEQLLHERLDACSLQSEDKNTQEGVSIAGKCSDTGGTDSEVCNSSLVSCGSKNSLPSNSQLLLVSAFVTSTKEFSKGLNRTAVCGKKQKAICSEGLACDACPEKSIQSEFIVNSSSTVKEGVSQEGLLGGTCIHPEGCSSSCSAHVKKEHCKLTCCEIFKNNTSVKEAAKEMPPSCNAYVVFAPECMCSNMESQHDCPSKPSCSRTKLSADGVGSWGNQISSESIPRHGTTVTCGIEITDSNLPCHKQNVCSSSQGLWKLGNQQSDENEDYNQRQSPTLKSKVVVVPDVETKAIRTTCHSAQDLKNLSSLNDVAHISSSSGSLEAIQLGSWALDGEISDSRERPVWDHGLEIKHEKEANLTKCIANGHHISTACTESTDSLNTASVQSRSEDAACTEYRPQGLSTALYISEAAARGVTLQGHCLQTAIECSKEDALNPSKCNTLSHIMCVLQLDIPGAKIAKNALANSSGCGHGECVVDNMHASAPRPSCSLSQHPEHIVSETDIPGQEHMRMCIKSICDSNSAAPGQLNPNVTDVGSDILLSGIPFEPPSTLGCSDLKCIDSAAIECSEFPLSLIQSLDLNSSPTLMTSSNESLGADAELVNNKSEPREEPLITCIAHQKPNSSESDLSILSENMTVTKEALSPELNRGGCATNLLKKQDYITLTDPLDISDLKGSVSGLPQERGAYESLGNAYYCVPSSLYHSSLSQGTRKKIEAAGVDDREEDLEHHWTTTSSKIFSKTGRVRYNSEKEMEFSTDQSLHCAASTVLQAHVQVDSTSIAELKMSCKQFSTEQPLLHGTFKYDIPEDMITERDLNMDAMVKPILQLERDCQTELVPADHTSSSKECSFTLLQGGLLQDNCQTERSKLELCTILPPPSNRQSSEYRFSMKDVEPCSASATAELVCDSFETEFMQCKEAEQSPKHDFPLDQVTSFKGNGACSEISFYNPCLATSQTQTICSLQAKYFLGVECHPQPEKSNSQDGHLAEVSKEKGCKVPFKGKRIWKGNRKCASESIALSVLDYRLNTDVCTGLEMERLMQTANYKRESASMRTVSLSTRSQKSNSIFGQDSVSRSEVKNLGVSYDLASKSTLQEIKRPKLSARQSGTLSPPVDASFLSGNINRCLLSCSSVPPKSAPCSPVHQEALESNTMVTCTNLFGALEGNLKPIQATMQKKQPDRKCKIIPSLAHFRTMRKMKPRKSLSCLKLSHESTIQQEHTLLNLSSTAANVLTSEVSTKRLTALVPKQRRFNCHFMNCLSTKEAAVLDRLSIMASKLLLPAQSSCTVKPSLSSSLNSLMLPDNCNLLRSNRLLEIFSCINMRINSQCSSSWSSVFSKEGPTHFMNQPIALYPGGSSKVHCANLVNGGSPTSFGTPSFPMAFHVKLDSSHLLDFASPPSQHYTPGRWQSNSLSAQPSEWTLSLFLSQCSSATEASSVFREDFPHSCELKPHAFCLRSMEATDTTHERGRSSLSRSQTVCSMHGLNTVLALSSPGCYRFWTRRRNLGSRIPSVQRLFMTQFTQGLKGMNLQASTAHEPFSSLPYSLGRVLSTWSRHGVSTSPSMFTNVHFNAWQPPVDIEISGHGQLPYIPIQGTSKTEILGPTLFSNHQSVSPLVLTPVPGLVTTLASSPLEHFTSQVHSFDDDIPAGACFAIQSSIETTSKVKEEKKPQRVSQIRIRRTMPKQDSNLTPMGLPRPKRIKKKEFSLEEIYTNKNYKSPPAARCLETIFEEPKEKNGALVAVSQQKRKRVLEFQDFTVPRKRKAKGKMKAVGGCTRGRRATLDGRELDALLIQKLMDLEIFLAEEDAREAMCGH